MFGNENLYGLHFEFGVKDETTFASEPQYMSLDAFRAHHLEKDHLTACDGMTVIHNYNDDIITALDKIKEGGLEAELNRQSGFFGGFLPYFSVLLVSDTGNEFDQFRNIGNK